MILKRKSPHRGLGLRAAPARGGYGTVPEADRKAGAGCGKQRPSSNHPPCSSRRQLTAAAKAKDHQTQSGEQQGSASITTQCQQQTRPESHTAQRQRAISAAGTTAHHQLPLSLSLLRHLMRRRERWCGDYARFPLGRNTARSRKKRVAEITVPKRFIKISSTSKLRPTTGWINSMRTVVHSPARTVRPQPADGLYSGYSSPNGKNSRILSRFSVVKRRKKSKEKS